MIARRITHIALYIVLTLTLMITGSPALAVINGTPDTTEEYPYVVLMAFETSWGTWNCSGTLLNPTVVLTAGHCTIGAQKARIWLQADMRGNAEYPYGGPTAIEGRPLLIPSYARRSFNNMMDVGLVILSRPVYLERYGQIANPTLLTSLTQNQLQQTDFTVVGYGHMQMENKQEDTAPVFHLRSSAVMKFAQSGSNYTLGLVSTNGQGATCFGDSGGPIFYNNTNLIVGVVSTGHNRNCGGLDLVYRVDTPFTHNWVDPFLR
jgi:V8-like Glu-specific endopeptidase